MSLTIPLMEKTIQRIPAEGGTQPTWSETYQNGGRPCENQWYLGEKSWGKQEALPYFAVRGRGKQEVLFFYSIKTPSAKAWLVCWRAAWLTEPELAAQSNIILLDEAMATDSSAVGGWKHVQFSCRGCQGRRVAASWNVPHSYYGTGRRGGALPLQGAELPSRAIFVCQKRGTDTTLPFWISPVDRTHKTLYKT